MRKLTELKGCLKRTEQTDGFKPNRGNATTLKAKQSIQARVAEILDATANRVQDELAWDAKALYKMVRDVYTDARLTRITRPRWTPRSSSSSALATRTVRR
jgi:hypothetical protein